MTAFNIDLNTEQPDRIFVEVDHRFDVAIERTETGLALHVYPRTEAELWDDPFITFEVDEAEVIALQNEIGLDAAPTTSQPTEGA
jgi:hypothetical protein